MKTRFTLLFTLISFFSISATYTSIANGNWTNESLVWSLDGSSPCFCSPPGTLAGDIVNINTNITLNKNLTLENNAQITIKKNSSLTGILFAIDIDNGLMTAKGPLKIATMKVGSLGQFIALSTDIEINTGLSVDGSFSLSQSTLQINNGDIDANGFETFTLSNNAKVQLFNGNFNNNGKLSINYGSCIELSNGNFFNSISGNITSIGSLLVANGIINNTGKFGKEISWCSSGSSIGMPTSANCPFANEICQGFAPLPVELIFFEGDAKMGYNELSWSTASELNSDYFLLVKSNDGAHWFDISSIPAAGNSTERIDYLHRDVVSNSSVAFYKLIQFDFDGSFEESHIVSIENIAENETTIYPNPAYGSFMVASNRADIDQVLIMDLSGASVFNQFTNQRTKVFEVNQSFVPGFYFVQVHKNNQIKTIKLLIK